MAKGTICLVDGCGKTAVVREHCKSHYIKKKDSGELKRVISPKGTALSFILDAAKYDGDECIFWPFNKDLRGYGQLKYEGRTKKSSRLVCEIVKGPPPEEFYHCAHECNKGHLSCVTPRHLFWKTPKDNAADKIKAGTLSRGESHGASKLTNEDIKNIRSLRGVFTQKEIAKMFSVSRGNISHIMMGDSWRHIK